MTGDESIENVGIRETTPFVTDTDAHHSCWATVTRGDRV